MSRTDVPYGFITENELFLSAWGTQPDRKIGEIKDDGPDAAVAYFQEKFKEFKRKIEELVQTIDASDNKGSYLMKLLHLKEQTLVHEGLGDYEELNKVLSSYEHLLSDIIQKNRERNTEIKSALMAEVKEAVEIVNWNESTDKVQDVKARWLKTGNARDDRQEELESEFWGIIEGFFERKRAFYEDKKRLTDHRKEKYLQIIEDANVLFELKGKARFDRVKELKAAWGEIGNIPAREYKELQRKFNNRLKGKKEIPPPNFDSIRAELDAMFEKTQPVDKPMLQRYRKSLSSFKIREKELKETRHDLMQLINLIWERDFLENLASKKYKGFHLKEEAEKRQIFCKLLKEFLRRDREDLKKYEENTEKFSGHDQNTNRMLERKLGQQRNKILVKEKLLEIMSENQ